MKTETKQIYFKYRYGKKYILPVNKIVDNWQFNEDEEDEAILANQLGILAEKSGITRTELQVIFPAILRMIKNKTRWSI